jgi:hypothetical protein
MIAERWPAPGWPIKRQFFLPIAGGRIAFPAMRHFEKQAFERFYDRNSAALFCDLEFHQCYFQSSAVSIALEAKCRRRGFLLIAARLAQSRGSKVVPVSISGS